MWYKKDFERLYQMYSKIPDLDPPKMLGGIFSTQENATPNAKELNYVGDRQRCLEWTGRATKELGEGKKRLDK